MARRTPGRPGLPTKDELRKRKEEREVASWSLNRPNEENKTPTPIKDSNPTISQKYKTIVKSASFKDRMTHHNNSISNIRGADNSCLELVPAPGYSSVLSVPFKH